MASRKIYFTTVAPDSTKLSYPYDTVVNGSLISPQVGDLIVYKTESNSYLYVIKEITYDSSWTISCQAFTGSGGADITIVDHKMIIA